MAARRVISNRMGCSQRLVHASALTIAAAALSALVGCGDGDARSPGGSSRHAASERILAQCQRGSTTNATDRRVDTVLQPALYPGGQPVRLGPGAEVKPFTGNAEPWVDLERVTVNVRRGLLCVTIRTAASAPRDADARYVLRIAPATDGGPVGPGVLLIGPGVSFDDGGQPEDEELVDHAYRQRGKTISVAVRVDVGHPRGIRIPLFSFSRFRWRVRSASALRLKGDKLVATVDCAPQDAWISYPQGQRADRPREADKALRCPRP